MREGETVKPCIYYPVPEDHEHGGVCYAGSELGRWTCTEEDQSQCEHAREKSKTKGEQE